MSQNDGYDEPDHLQCTECEMLIVVDCLKEVYRDNKRVLVCQWCLEGHDDEE